MARKGFDFGSEELLRHAQARRVPPNWEPPKLTAQEITERRAKRKKADGMIFTARELLNSRAHPANDFMKSWEDLDKSMKLALKCIAEWMDDPSMRDYFITACNLLAHGMIEKQWMRYVGPDEIQKMYELGYYRDWEP
jgi:hypothetical protein